MPKVDLFRDVPGYAEEAARESVIRDVAFLGLPETVAGIECAPLTARRYLWLHLAGSPFLGDLTAEQKKRLAESPDLIVEILRWFWIVSPDFQAGNRRKQARCNARLRPLLKQRTDDCVNEIMAYMEEAFMDAPEGERGKSFYSIAASLALFFGQKMRLDIDAWENGFLRNLVRRITGRPNPIDIPLKVVWQLMRANRVTTSGETIFTNRLSDAVVNSHLRELNKANN